MKNLLLIIGIMTIGISNIFGQKQGVYQLKYKGEVISKNLTIKAVKLPTTLYLHGKEDKKNMVFYSSPVNNNKVELLCSSHLMDLDVVSFEDLKTIYLKETTSLPIELIVTDGQWERTKKVYLSWDKVKFLKPQNGDVYTLMIDFGKIEL